MIKVNLVGKVIIKNKLKNDNNIEADTVKNERHGHLNPSDSSIFEAHDTLQARLRHSARSIENAALIKPYLGTNISIPKTAKEAEAVEMVSCAFKLFLP